MDTRIFGTKTEDLMRAAEILKNGGLVAFPTETVYGLGADALNPEAVGKVYAAKGRPSDNPMIVHIADKEELKKLTSLITDDMEKFMEAFWPGPLTMVVPALDVVPKVTTGGLSTVAVRFPSDPVAAELIRLSGTPIAAPSANLSGKPSPTTARHVVDDLEGRIDAIIAGADCKVGIESTVVDMTGDVPSVLRPGIITPSQLSDALGRTVEIDPALLKKPDMRADAPKNAGNQKADNDNPENRLLVTSDDFKPKSPGMKYKHYAPNAEMIIYKGEREKVLRAISEEKMKREKIGDRVEVIVFDNANAESAAHDFFARLRDCDRTGVDVILAVALDEEGVGFAVMNRMFKSAGYNVVEVE